MTDLKVEWIEWKDAFGDHGWMPISDVVEAIEDVGGVVVVTVGFVLHENDDWIAVSHTVTGDSHTYGSIVIPKGWIVERLEVKLCPTVP